MQTIEATYRIVTPMFIGGADQKASDGIRPPSFKGALRFWWRALNWGKYHDLAKLHQREAELFGSAVNNGKGGQGKFLLVVEQPRNLQPISDWPNSHTARGETSKSGYLGLGLFPMGEHKRREAIREGQMFTVTLRFCRDAVDADMDSVTQALKALGLFGGLGSRARRGFGSVALESLSGEELAVSDLPDYQRQIEALFHSTVLAQELPPYTAFSKAMKVALDNNSQADARTAHSRAGNRYINHRGQPSSLRGVRKKWFGLPLVGVSDARRGSPLFFHIHPVGNKFTCLNLVMPTSEWLPGESANAGAYRDVESFLDDLQEVRV